MSSDIFDRLNENLPGFPNDRLKLKHAVFAALILTLVLTLGAGYAGYVYLKARVSQIVEAARLSEQQEHKRELANFQQEFRRVRTERDTLIKHLLFPDPTVYDSLDDFGKTTLVREWVTQNIPRAVNADEHNNVDDYATLILRAMQKEAGFMCGGMAQILMYLYDALGFEAATLNMGIASSPSTHVVTLVKIQLNNEHRIIVQDPLFGTTYVGGNGSPAGINDLLGAVEKRDVKTYFRPDKKPFYHKSKKGDEYYLSFIPLTLIQSRMESHISNYCGMPPDLASMFWFPLNIFSRFNEPFYKHIQEIYDELGLKEGVVICPG